MQEALSLEGSTLHGVVFAAMSVPETRGRARLLRSGRESISDPDREGV